METLTETNLLFKAFADETRMRMLHILTVGELCVCDVMEILDLPQSKASRQLSYLRRAGLAKSRKEGLWVYYSLDAPKTRLQKNILECIKCCFRDVPIMTEDLKRAEAAAFRQSCSD